MRLTYLSQRIRQLAFLFVVTSIGSAQNSDPRIGITGEYFDKVAKELSVTIHNNHSSPIVATSMYVARLCADGKTAGKRGQAEESSETITGGLPGESFQATISMDEVVYNGRACAGARLDSFAVRFADGEVGGFGEAVEDLRAKTLARDSAMTQWLEPVRAIAASDNPRPLLLALRDALDQDYQKYDEVELGPAQSEELSTNRGVRMQVVQVLRAIAGDRGAFQERFVAARIQQLVEYVESRGRPQRGRMTSATSSTSSR